VQTIGSPIAAAERNYRPTAGSVLAHLLVILTFAAIFHHSPRWVAPYRLPGTAHGTQLMMSYQPNRAPEQSALSHPKTEPVVTAAKSPLAAPARQAKASPLPSVNSSASAQPNAATGADALGMGNITIALLTYFPTPHPDLSPLPRGTKGDVILDVVIDTTGKISDLKMVSGLGGSIDEAVIATVKQWTFHPALQNGNPVASEQELLFHYERG
jgi:periplasmic protein TonB